MIERDPVFHETIQALYIPDVVSVTPESPIGYVIDLMRKKKVDYVLVLDNGLPIGIFTGKNVILIAASKNREELDQPVSTVMSTSIVTTKESTVMDDAFKMMSVKKVSHLVVVSDQGGVKGIISKSHLMQHLGLEYFVEFKQIQQIMNCNVVTSEVHTRLSDAVSRMAGNELSCLVIVEDGKPIGIVTEHDISRLIRELKADEDPALGEIMTSPVLTIDVSTSVYDATIRMKKRQVRRLVVVDGENTLQGLVTLSDIIWGLEGRYIRDLHNAMCEKEIQLREAVTDSLKKQIFLDSILSSSLQIGLIATDEKFHITYFNNSAKRILGFDPEQILGRDLESIHIELGLDPERIRSVMNKACNDERHSFSFELERPGLIKRYLDASISCILDDQKSIHGYVLTLHDVTERHQSEETIWKLAYHDPLTQLPNRLLIADRLNLALSAAERNNDCMAVMLLDLDRFKYINDTLGHTAGDKLLISVARSLEKPLRKSDTVARMGGDEFLILLPHIGSENDASLVAEKIMNSVRVPHNVGEHIINVTTSIGVALYPHDGTDVESLIKAADNALYKAKDLGRDVYTFL